MKLSARLQQIATLISRKTAILDVGCDHGYLSQYLLSFPECQTVIASDISQKCLDKVHSTDSHLQKRMGNGLDVISKQDNIQTIIIAGMGGRTIAKILDGKTFDADLIVSPQSHSHLVRQKLLDKNYQIVVDFYIQDSGKYYTIIKAVHKDSPIWSDTVSLNSIPPDSNRMIRIDCLPTKNQLQYGIYFPQDTILKQYLQKKLLTLQNIDNVQTNQKQLQIKDILNLFQV